MIASNCVDPSNVPHLRYCRHHPLLFDALKFSSWQKVPNDRLAFCRLPYSVRLILFCGQSDRTSGVAKYFDVDWYFLPFKFIFHYQWLFDIAFFRVENDRSLSASFCCLFLISVHSPYPGRWTDRAM